MALLASSPRPKPALAWTQLLIAHPLVAFFVLAFAGAWIGTLPLVFEKFGLLPSGIPVEPFMIIGAFMGPPLAAIIVTAATGGWPEVVRLLRRVGQWRVGS